MCCFQELTYNEDKHTNNWTAAEYIYISLIRQESAETSEKKLEALLERKNRPAGVELCPQGLGEMGGQSFSKIDQEEVVLAPRKLSLRGHSCCSGGGC